MLGSVTSVVERLGAKDLSIRRSVRRLRRDRGFHHHVPILVHAAKFAAHHDGSLADDASCPVSDEEVPEIHDLTVHGHVADLP